MKKRYRYLILYLKTTFKNLKRNFGLALSASFSVSITLVLIALFAIISSNLNNITQNVEGQVTIRASVERALSADEKSVLQEQIQAIPEVKKIALSTGDEELQAYKDEYANESNLFSMYEGETNPIKDAYIIEVYDSSSLANVSTTLNEISGISNVEYGGDATSNMIQSFTTIRDGSVVFIIFLISVAVFLIANKIKMSIYTRKNEIAIMRYVGSSNTSIKLPMMLEGVFIGFFGSIIPVIITIWGYIAIYHEMGGNLVSNMFQLSPVYPLTINVSLLLIGIGAFVGLFGSMLSTTRYLHWKR